MSKRVFELMSNEKYNNEHIVEYVITVKEKKKGLKYTLSYSNSHVWNSHVKGKKILSALDHGNGVTVKNCASQYIGKAKGFNLEYDEFAELTMLFTFMKEFSNNMMMDLETREVVKFPADGKR